MSDVPFRLAVASDHMVDVGRALWLNRNGSVVAITDLYEPSDPTDEPDEVRIPPGMDWITALHVNPSDLNRVKKLLGQ